VKNNTGCGLRWLRYFAFREEYIRRVSLAELQIYQRGLAFYVTDITKTEGRDNGLSIAPSQQSEKQSSLLENIYPTFCGLSDNVEIQVYLWSCVRCCP
jgi:hypothetical protein